MNEADVLSTQSRSFFHAVNDMRLRDELTDVTVICGERTFKAHRAILSGGSQYFRTMFLSGMQETIEGRVNLQGIHPNTFEVILNVLYCEPFRIPNDRERVKNLLTASHLLQIQSLFTLCCERYLAMLTPEFFLDIWNTAELYGITKALERVPEFLTDNFRSMCRSCDFLCLSFEQVKVVATKANFKGMSADWVIEAVLIWVKHEEITRKETLKELFESVDLNTLSPHFMESLLDSEELIQTSADILKTLMKTATSRIITGSLQQEHSMKLFFFGAPLSGLQYFDLQNKEWSAVIHMSNFDIPDLLERAPVYFDNHMYFIGGEDGRSTYKYKPFTCELKQMPARLNHFRNRPWGSSLNGMIYCVGGLAPNKERNRSVERYDPFSDSWELVAATHHAFYNLNVVTLGERLFVVDSQEFRVESYDPVGNQWTVINTPQNSANLIKYYQVPTVACLDKLYVYSRTRQLWSYCPATDKWQQCKCDITNVIKGMWSVCTNQKKLPYILILDNAGFLYHYDPNLGTSHRYSGSMKFIGKAWNDVLIF